MYLLPATLLTGLPAIITGAIAVARRHRGKRLAVAGIKMGVLGNGIMLLMLVVAAVVALSSKPKTIERPPVNSARFSRQIEGRLLKLEDGVAKARAEFPGVQAEQWQRINDDIAKTRRILTEMAAISEQTVLEDKRVEAQNAYLDAWRRLRVITREADPDP